MNKLIILISLLIYNNSYIQIIGEKCNVINKNINKFNVVELKDIDVYNENNNEYSIEGTSINNLLIINLQKYYSNKKIIKVNAIFFGDFEELQSQYYFENEKLIHVKKGKKQYSKRRSNYDFDSTKYISHFDNYYFQNDSLILWQKNSCRFLEERTMQFIQEENNILHDSNIYINYKE